MTFILAPDLQLNLFDFISLNRLPPLCLSLGLVNLVKVLLLLGREVLDAVLDSLTLEFRLLQGTLGWDILISWCRSRSTEAWRAIFGQVDVAYRGESSYLSRGKAQLLDWIIARLVSWRHKSVREHGDFFLTSSWTCHEVWTRVPCHIWLEVCGQAVSVQRIGLAIGLLANFEVLEAFAVLFIFMDDRHIGRLKSTV